MFAWGHDGEEGLPWGWGWEMAIQHHNDAFMSHQVMPHKTRSHPRLAPMQCTLHKHTVGHCKHPLWLLYDVWSTWQLWLQVSYQIPTHPDYHSMHKGIDNLPLDTQKYINVWSIGSLRWPCRIFWKLLSCAGRKAWGRITEIGQPVAITNTKVTNTYKHLVEHAYAYAEI